MWSGDAFQAAYRAEEAENGQVIEYVIPDEGTNMWFDMMALPVDAKNVDNAYKFIDYMMRPEVAANNVNYVWYASGNQAANPMIDQEVLDHILASTQQMRQRKSCLLCLYMMPRQIV